jgi:hypothetical protein
MVLCSTPSLSASQIAAVVAPVTSTATSQIVRRASSGSE